MDLRVFVQPKVNACHQVIPKSSWPNESSSAPASRSDAKSNSILDGLQTVLDLVGFIPGVGEVADVVNAGISAMRGDYLGAALSLVSLLPVVGDAIGKGAKYALKVADAGVARKTLAALQNVDLASYFNKLAQHPQLAKYLEPLRQALDTLAEKLARIAGVQVPHLAMAGGGKLPSSPVRNNVVQMSGDLANGYKRGDHVFNNGLTKLGLQMPSNSFLGAAFQKFQAGLKNIEAKGGFNLVANKGARGADLNSQLFGEHLADLRQAWQRLDEVLANPSANAQHRAAAVLWTMEALKKLRQSSYDADAVLAKIQGLSRTEVRKIQQQVARTTEQLDAVFGSFMEEIAKLLPSSTAVGQSISGFR